MPLSIDPRQSGRVKTLTIIVDGQGEGARTAQVKTDLNSVGLGVFAAVVQRLLHHPKQGQFERGRQPFLCAQDRQLDRKLILLAKVGAELAQSREKAQLIERNRA